MSIMSFFFNLNFKILNKLILFYAISFDTMIIFKLWLSGFTVSVLVSCLIFMDIPFYKV